MEISKDASIPRGEISFGMTDLRIHYKAYDLSDPNTSNVISIIEKCALLTCNNNMFHRSLSKSIQVFTTRDSKLETTKFTDLCVGGCLNVHLMYGVE